ncbi:Tetratricopeptide-like helical [Niveomyces insectorum RCEF 264]|uniref:Tetratricopeptide-like helical n=1 Tax=Niveomyces insectorum RCEF 264 TaxID=1081102 RepID=A0A167X8P3_9HYPO|nr:Tetratricopeptide-like helical [Niveomyces insectorum RCEF 264]
MPKLEATFVPSGYDDYYMPEVIAPSPQRVMPEVPQNMQQDLQRMELEARQDSIYNNKNNQASLDYSRAQQHGRDAPFTTGQAANAGYRAGPGAPSATTPQGSADDFKAFPQDNSREIATFDTPSFSPFPHVQGDNIPPSDEEKEKILYNARTHVLNSNDISVQLLWARDALGWVETAVEARLRKNSGQTERPATPKVEHELRVDAFNIVEYLASQNHPDALFIRAKWLEFGRFGVRQDKEAAFMGYRSAASRGCARAEYRIGMFYEDANDMQNALTHYERGSEMGDSAASYRLGMLNLLGQHGYEKNYELGLQLIQSAAETADEDAPQGAYVYGMLISRELPDINIPESILPLDLKVARQYIEKAAYLGFAKAQLKMGQAYELCQLGCDFNPALSLHYYGLAAHQNQPEAALGVSRWFLFGYDHVFPKNELLAFQYAKQAADAGLATGEFAIGYYNEIGIHVQKNLQDARMWYERAAAHGNKDAVGRLEGLNQAKTLTKQDHETTALTRIKSKYGSQRGKRPDRLSNRQKDPAAAAAALPSVPETTSTTATDTPSITAVASTGNASLSQNLSPAQHPAQGTSDVPRLPAFSITLDQSNTASRPKSTAPYPVDDRPAPLNLSRPKSTAPYPDDGTTSQRPLSPHFNPQIRQSAGAQPGNRPMSAFGIRPNSMNAQTGPQFISASQSTGNLVPEPRPFSANMTGRPLDTDPRGRIASAGWQPQVPNNGGYRGTSPRRDAAASQAGYRASQDYGYQQTQPQQQTSPLRQPGGAPAVTDNARNRLSKTNPNSNAGGAYGGGPGVGLSAQPGRDYGPRTSSRPVSSAYPTAGVAGRPDRIDSLPSQAQKNYAPLQGGSGVAGAGGMVGNPLHKNRPLLAEGGRQSAPPVQSNPGGGFGAAPARPVSVAPPRTSSLSPAHAANSGSGAASRPAQQPAKPAKAQGPATFEEMGIPQGKSDDDCCIM